MARMTIKRVKDTQEQKCIMHRIADYRGGLGFLTEGIPAGTVVPEGTLVSILESDWGESVKRVCTPALLGFVKEVDETKKVITISKDPLHACWEGRSVYLGGKNASVESVDTSDPESDVLTVSTALSDIAVGSVITDGFEIAGVTGTSVVVKANANIQMDVWLMAVVKGNSEDLRNYVNKTVNGIKFV